MPLEGDVGSGPAFLQNVHGSRKERAYFYSSTFLDSFQLHTCKACGDRKIKDEWAYSLSPNLHNAYFGLRLLYPPPPPLKCHSYVLLKDDLLITGGMDDVNAYAVALIINTLLL